MKRSGAPRARSRYIHGTTLVEQRRLSRMNDLLNAAALREIGPCEGARILDVGCGLGQLSRALSRAAGPDGSVLGIERSPEQIALAHRLARDAGEERLVAIRRGDAVRLPLRRAEWGSFDLAHTRFLLEHLPDPLAVVRAMVRAVRPGGRVVLQDDDHDVLRLWPESPGFEAMWRAYIRTYDRNGNDPYIGRRLVALLHAAGAVPERNTWLFFGACAGSPRFDELVLNLVRIIEGARAAILEADLLDAEAFEQGLRAFRTWGQQRGAALWFAVCYAEGRRP